MNIECKGWIETDDGQWMRDNTQTVLHQGCHLGLAKAQGTQYHSPTPSDNSVSAHPAHRGSGLVLLDTFFFSFA